MASRSGICRTKAAFIELARASAVRDVRFIRTRKSTESVGFLVRMNRTSRTALALASSINAAKNKSGEEDFNSL